MVFKILFSRTLTVDCVVDGVKSTEYPEASRISPLYYYSIIYMQPLSAVVYLIWAVSMRWFSNKCITHHTWTRLFRIDFLKFNFIYLFSLYKFFVVVEINRRMDERRLVLNNEKTEVLVYGPKGVLQCEYIVGNFVDNRVSSFQFYTFLLYLISPSLVRRTIW